MNYPRLFALLISLSGLFLADVAFGATINTQSQCLILRSGSSTRSRARGCYRKGRRIKVLGEENGFYRVRVNGRTGYMKAQYIRRTSSPSQSTSRSSGGSKVVKGVSRCLRFRSGPSSRSRTLRCFKNGSKFEDLGMSGNGYRKVKVNGRVGYLHDSYLGDTKPETTKQSNMPVPPPPSAPPRAPIDPPPLPGKSPGFDVPDAGGSGGEVTDNAEANPQPQPEAIDTSAMDCPDSSWQHVSYGKSARNNCWKGKSNQEKAAAIMDNVKKINSLRKSFNMDPRFSVCIANRESNMIPNQGWPPGGKGGRRASSALGMYQIIKPTHKGNIRQFPPVTPRFKNYSMAKYRKEMVKSILAQTDIHHAVMAEKAKYSKMTRRVNSGSEDPEVYATLANWYYGKFKPKHGRQYRRSKAYTRAIRSCYICIKSVYTREGAPTGRGNLKTCLRKAKGK